MVFQNGVPVSGVGGIPQAFPQIVAQPTVQMIPMMQPMMPIRMQTLAMPTMQAMQPRVSQAYYQFDGPPVTVFVGNIAEDVTDTLVRQILMKVGPVTNWKRVQGTNGKLQGFGFCEYKEPDSALRSLRLLQGLAVCGKQLLIKVDDQAQNVIENWKITVGLKKDSDGMDVISPQIREKDEQVRSEIKALLKEYQADIPPPASKEEQKEPEKEKKEEKKPESGEKEKSENPEEPKKTDERKDERSKSPKKRSKSREASQRKRSRSRSKSARTRKRSRSKERSRPRRSRSRNRERTRDNSRERSRERERRRRSLERRKEEDEMLERRRLERKMKEKHSAYQERLQVWEARERRKAREWDRIEYRDNERRKQMAKEARRLRDFLESYNDEKDDRKFYFGSGSAFSKRQESRKREIEDDAKDKKKEEGEISLLHEKLAGEGHPDPNGAIAKVIKEAEEVWQPFIKPDVRIKKGKRRDSTSSTDAEESEESSDESGRESDDEPLVSQIMKNNEPEKPVHHTSDEDDEDGVEMDLGDNPAPPEAPPISLPALSIPKASDSPTARKKNSRNVPSIFNEEEPSEDPSLPGARKRKRETPKPREIMSADEKRRAVKALIERIPTDKGPLFAYPMKWEYLGKELMEKRISPWVKKKLNEIIGEDEPTLITFITDKLSSESKPEQILSEIQVVLDEEAEVFVIKLWRLLVYETEARAEGISA